MSDNVTRTITLSVITIGGVRCIWELPTSIIVLCNCLTLNFLRAPIWKAARDNKDSAVPANHRIPPALTGAGYSPAQLRLALYKLQNL
jgi:hypothetical protein